MRCCVDIYKLYRTWKRETQKTEIRWEDRRGLTRFKVQAARIEQEEVKLAGPQREGRRQHGQEQPTGRSKTRLMDMQHRADTLPSFGLG